METTKVFSLRVTNALAELIDQKVEHFTWWKRNSLLCQILFNLLKNASDSDIRTLLQYNRFSRKKLVISIREEEISENDCSM